MLRADISGLLVHYLGVTVQALGTSTDPFKGKRFIQPGGEVAWDQCDCDGQAWSRFVSGAPVYGTPKANGVPCVVHWDFTLAVGVLRCVQVPSTARRLPKGETITTDGHVFAGDLLALMTAIECDPQKYRVLEAVPLGPEGGCAGSEVRFTVRVAPCCP